VVEGHRRPATKPGTRTTNTGECTAERLQCLGLVGQSKRIVLVAVYNRVIDAGASRGDEGIHARQRAVEMCGVRGSYRYKKGENKRLDYLPRGVGKGE